MSKASILIVTIIGALLASCERDPTVPEAVCIKSRGSGYTDRWGRELFECTERELQCIKPLSLASKNGHLTCVLDTGEAVS